MTRRALFALLFFGAEARAESQPWAICNEYAKAWQAWADLRNARVSDTAKVGTIDAGEVRAWRRVKRLRQVAEAAIDYEYGAK